MNVQIQEKIINDLKSLNSFQLTEVSDFVEFLNHKDKTTLKDRNAISALRGKYKNHMTSSDNFAKRKQEEIELEEKKWRRK